MAKYFAKLLNGRQGTLINLSSGNAIFTSYGQSSYCANKVASLRIIEQLHVGKQPSHLPRSQPPDADILQRFRILGLSTFIPEWSTPRW